MDKNIEDLCKLNNITSKAEIQLIKKAIHQKKDSIVLDQEVFTSKKWTKFKADLQSIKGSSKPNSSLTRNKQYPIYTRFAIHQKPCNSNKIKCVVMGPCGNGKTSLINHLCGSNLQTGHTKTSLTREVTEMESLISYDLPFIVYDTPGTTAHQDKLRHAIHLKEILSFRPINSVIILVKYQARYDDLVNNVYRQVKMLQNYSENIIYLVSHFDLAQDPQFVIQQTDKMFKQLKINNQIIFYSNNGVNKKQLSDKIYKISKSMPQRKIQIDEKTFFKYFNLKKEETEQMYFKEEQLQILQMMEDITDIYIQNAVNLPNNDQRDAILQDLQFALKNQLKQLFDGFVQKFQNTMSTMEYYTSYFTLQLKINEHLTQYQQKIRSLQKYNLIQSESKDDIRDLIKKCPNKQCGLIWFRVQSCPNTVCGKRPSCIFDFMKSKFFRYRITRQKKSRKLNIVRAQQYVNQNKGNLNENTIVSNSSIQQRVKQNQVGCGQAMNFSTLPRLPNIEQLLIEFYNVHTMEEVIVRFNQEEKLQRQKKKLQNQITFGFMRRFIHC